MNGKASKRIRAAAVRTAAASGAPRDTVALAKIGEKLKREYRLLPYHRRAVPVPGVVSQPHRVAIAMFRGLR